MDSQAAIDQKNCEYWNTLCGTSLAESLGIYDLSRDSLAKYDQFYLDFYPYLLRYVNVDALRGKKVLEIGLGYGTLAQVLMQVADYTGLDIAQGPVEVVNIRAHYLGQQDRAVQGSILKPPFESASYDAVVTIGCLHHTGDLAGALHQIARLLKPGGAIYFMVYHAYSYRRWLSYPWPTLRQFVAEYCGLGMAARASQKERSAYDQNAPETVFTSPRTVRTLLLEAGFEPVYIAKENAAPESVLRFFSRAFLLRWLAPYAGLDLYVKAVKRS